MTDCDSHRFQIPVSALRQVLLIQNVLGSLARITTILAEVPSLFSFVFCLYYSGNK
jgi:hypothetical protein